MNKNLREVRKLIERGGGREIEMEGGRRHLVIRFTNPKGDRCSLPIYAGTNPKRYEDCLRSELRRAGLNP